MSGFKRILAGTMYVLRYIAALGIPMAIGGVAYLLIDARIEHQETRNRFLQVEIQKLDQSIREVRVNDRTIDIVLTHVELIEHSRKPAVDVAELVMELSHLPEGVALTRFVYKPPELLIEGQTSRQSLVWRLSDAMNRHPMIASTALRSVETLESNGRARFSMKATLAGTTENEE